MRAGDELDASRVCSPSFVVLVGVSGAVVVLTGHRGGDAVAWSFPSLAIGNFPIGVSFQAPALRHLLSSGQTKATVSNSHTSTVSPKDTLFPPCLGAVLSAADSVRTGSAAKGGDDSLMRVRGALSDVKEGSSLISPRFLLKNSPVSLLRTRTDLPDVDTAITTQGIE